MAFALYNVVIFQTSVLDEGSDLQNQIPKLNDERKTVSKKRNRQSIERIVFAPGSETLNEE